jgi:hypothetical protein
LYEYMVYVEAVGLSDVPQTFRSETRLRDGDMIEVGGMQVVVVEVVEQAVGPRVGLIEADPVLT